jgi:Protein of unknown function (DUF1761)
MLALPLFISALVPLIIGFLWYNNSVFGKAWMQASGLNVEDLKKGSMAKQLGFTYLFSVLLAFALQFLVVHQLHVGALIGNELYNTTANQALIAPIEAAFKNNFRYFGHGALHGGLSGFMLSLAIIGITSLFERRSWKYIFIHVGYWTITLLIMGGIISAWH